MKHALAVLAALLLTGCAAGTSHSVADTNTSSTTTSTSKAAKAAPAPTTEAPPRDLRASDLKPTLKIKSKQCFGSAGCSIEASVRLAWVGSYRPADEDSYTVTYAIGGVENGPQIGSIDISGVTKYDAPNEILSTPGSPHLTVRITDVEKTS